MKTSRILSVEYFVVGAAVIGVIMVASYLYPFVGLLNGA
jgi:hypothetical protein